MSGLDWESMKNELVRGGVRPKYIIRTLNELQSHYDELKCQAVKEGLTEGEADDRARTYLGDEQALLTEVLSRPELKSLAWRFPKTIFSLGPILAAVAATVFFFIALFILANTLSWFGNMSAGTEIAMWEKILVEGLVAFNCYLLTPIVAVSTVMLAKQRQIHFYWPGLGIVILVALGSGWAYTISWPTDGMPGTLQINWGYSFFPRAIRGDHDLQNYFQILFALSFAAISWRAYESLENYKADRQV